LVATNRDQARPSTTWPARSGLLREEKEECEQYKIKLVMSTTGSTGPPATAPNLSLIYVISFLDLFAVSLIIPIFTTIYKSLDLDPITFGLVSSVYGLAQFLCNPIIGRLSDRYGRKSLLLLSFLGSAVGTPPFKPPSSSSSSCPSR
jgi:fucose permease